MSSREQQVAAMASAGRTQRQMADALGVSISTVCRLLLRARAATGDKRRWGRKPDAAAIAAFRARIAAGVSMSRLAREFGVNPRTFSRWVAEQRKDAEPEQEQLGVMLRRSEQRRRAEAEKRARLRVELETLR